MLNITSLDIDVGVKMNIAHMLRVRGKLSDVAESLGISRPSLYKYMQLYDKGTTDQIPPDVLNYFNDIASDETKRFELMHMIESESVKIDCELSLCRNKLDVLMNERIVIMNKLASDENIDQDVASELNEKMRIIDSAIKNDKITMEKLLKKKEDLYSEMKQNQKAMHQMNHAEDVPACIKTKCFREDGTFMVAYDDPESCGEDHILSLMAKFGEEYKTIGTYDAVKGKNFFIISDIIYSPYLYYSVNRIMIDDDGNRIIDEDYRSKISQFKR